MIEEGGDFIDSSGRKWKVGRQLAYRGKEDCSSLTCTRMGIVGTVGGTCFGWHCPYCDEPCSSQGHDCKNAPTDED